MGSAMTRRAFAKRLAGGLIDRRGSLLARLPGAPLLAAGCIVRDGRGRVVGRDIDGLALRPSGIWRRFGFDDPFRVASVSKMVSATGFFSLVRAGRIDLDADNSDYLGARLRHPAFPDTPIATRQLLSHTSGLRNGEDFPPSFNRPLLARLRRAADEPNYGGWFSPPQQPPGQWFGYSDVNFGLLAQIVERVTQTRFDRFMRTALFDPLGLDIGYNWSGVSQHKRSRAAAACRWIDGAWTPQVDASPPQAPGIAFYRGDDDPNATEADHRVGENGLAFAPHGGLRLSLNDMDRLARFYARGGEDIAAMSAPAWRFTPDAPNGATENGFYQGYGLGVQAPLGAPGDGFFGPDTPDWRGHCGDAYGWMTGVWWNRRNGASLVYAVNGMPETGRLNGPRSALTAAEEVIVDLALAALS